MLERYGWNDHFQREYDKLDTPFKPARVTAQHKNYYHVIASECELVAEMAGRFEYLINSPEEIPVTGDWVLADIFKDGKAIIHDILPRKNLFSRKRSGKELQAQVIAANLDLIFIITGLDHNFSIPRVQRYLSVVDFASIKPVLIFNKTDVAEDLEQKKQMIHESFNNIVSVFTSAINKEGMEEIKHFLKKGQTVCFVGSSGVGKSTIINGLTGEDRIRTKEVRQKDSKGRHTTSARQMFPLPNGALVIDTPGMRELGLWCDEDDLDHAFSDIANLAVNCRFRDCAHTTEPGCAVLKALETGKLSESQYKSYFKLKKELKYIKSKQSQKGSFNPKLRWKERSKMIKNYKKIKGRD
ncbi:MAG: ribosome small subunit-dependent GTPase A [Spirochaetes bacterium]|nr:ribosome small subunit-dependent GTPase A [Spirochaetota bacterium]